MNTILSFSTLSRYAVVLLAGCVVATAPQPRALLVPAAGRPIEVGCSYNGTEFKGEVGETFQVACPANCGDTGGLWGTDVYTADYGTYRLSYAVLAAEGRTGPAVSPPPAAPTAIEAGCSYNATEIKDEIGSTRVVIGEVHRPVPAFVKVLAQELG